MSNIKSGIIIYMASGESTQYNLPYPQVDDSVNVHGDIESLVNKLEDVLPGLGLSYFKHQVKNVSGETIPASTPVYVTGYSTKTTVAKALPTTIEPIFGLTKTSIADGAEGIVIVAGIMENVNTSSFEEGSVLYVAEGGGLTDTRPTEGSGAVGIVAYSDAANGIIAVEAKGNGTWGALKNGLA